MTQTRASAPVRTVLERLEGVKTASEGWVARCPAHEDERPSLSITQGDADCCVLHCHAGCTPESIAAALGLKMADLFVSRIAATYDYVDEAGRLLYQAVRFEPKDFRQRCPNGPNAWTWSLKGVRRVLYRLPEVLQAIEAKKPIYVVEGEKDVEALRALGLVATCNAMGAQKWRSEYSESLRGADVVVLPDNDAPGLLHAQQVQRGLRGIARSIKVVNLPGLGEHGDVSDWLAAGGTRAELQALIADVTENQEITEVEVVNQPNQENRANRERKRFTFTPLSSLLAEPEEEVDYVISNLLIAGGVSILGAKPKVGKSTLARNAALAVARGGRFLDRQAVAGPVVYLALEEKRSQVAKHFASMGATTESISVHVGSAPEDALAELTVAIETHRPILAIIDPLFKLVRLRDGNDYTEVSRALEPLIDLARDSGCHLLCAHHLGKGDRSGGDAVLGSTALFGAVDTLLLMKRSSEGVRTIETIQRYGDDMPATVVKLDGITGIVEAAGDVETLKLEEAGAAVIKALGDETLTEQEIRGRVGGNESLTSKALRDLLDKGRVTRTGSGRRGDPYQYAAALIVAENTRFSRLAHIGNRENRETEKRDGGTMKPRMLMSEALQRFYPALKAGDLTAAAEAIRDWPQLEQEQALLAQHRAARNGVGGAV